MKTVSSYSLRKRLWVVVLLSSTVLWAIGLSVILGVGWHISDRLMNDALRESARLIIAITTDFHERGILPERIHEPMPSDDRRSLQYQIVAGGRVISRTDFAPQEPFLPNFRQDQGHQDIMLDGHRWRIYVVKNRGGNFEAQVGRPFLPQFKRLRRVGLVLVPAALALLLLLSAVSWWIADRMMSPLRQAATIIATKSPQDLSLVAVDKPPEELVPLLDSLNRVLARLERALETERRFTADAAHELRTPLAALRMKAQLLERQQPELAPALSKLTADINRCTGLIEQLLLLARLDPLNPTDSGLLLKQETKLLPFIENLVVPHKETATQRHIRIETDADPELKASTNPDMLAVALRNLIDNALIYIEEGCRIEISAKQDNQTIHIRVADNGPGISPEHYAQLTDRFFRILGTGKPGSGLGLSIVQRIAELHGGSLDFGKGLDGKGFSATLTIPL